MRKLIQKILLVNAVGLLVHSASAFSLSGPVGHLQTITGATNGSSTVADTWQTQALGFNPLITGVPDNPFGFGDAFPTGPKNLGQGYRRNTPVMYYTFDQNFLNYFGSDGTNAVNDAFAILNSLTNVDNYSSNLTEFPFDASGVNHQAQALFLLDIKSVTLSALVYQLGLDDAIRYSWVIHSRWHLGDPPCPVGENYVVTERNFDIVPTALDQLQYSPYVNSALYSYEIFEYCTPTAPSSLVAAAVAYPADPLNNEPPVASGWNGMGTLDLGQYYTGLTRDDVAGLRYLYRAPNVNVESPAQGSVLRDATTNAPVLLRASNLGTLLDAARVNDPATLQTLFPGLVVDTENSTYYPTNIPVPDYTLYFTNFPGSAIGAPPTLVIVTNYTYVPAINYSTKFLNVITNSYSNQTPVTVLTTSNINLTGSAVGSGGTPTTATNTTYINRPTGTYYLVPPDACGWSILSTVNSTNYTITTNAVTTITNTASDGISSNIYFISQTDLIYSTNPVYFAQLISCGGEPAPAAQYEGIEQMRFVYVDPRNLDTATGNFITPITNNYTMSKVIFTNGQNQVVIQNFQRVVTAPDFLISAADLIDENGKGGLAAMSDPRFNQSNILPGEAGPGTIDLATNGPSVEIWFNNSGPLFGNASPYFLFGPDSASGYVYASFDGSTNTPIIYPNGTSISDLENQLFIQISPDSVALLDATQNAPYSVTFSATGGQAPYTWSSPTNSVLPAGLSISSGGVLSGTPQQIGTFDVVVQMTDSASPIPRIVQRNYALTIH